MPSFDVVSKLDQHEVDNAVNQAAKEVATRYDFRDTETEIERNKDGIALRADSEGRLDAARGILEEKFVRRKVSLSVLDVQKAEAGGGQRWRQLIKLKEGVDSETAKAIVKHIKDSKAKVQAAIQGDVVRVTGKKRDDLQEVIASLRTADFGLPLQFINFRE